ncbi:hypothetical protein V6N13_092983 [Hibiscus sabdariffa]
MIEHGRTPDASLIEQPCYPLVQSPHGPLEKCSLPIAEQRAWALGYATGKWEELCNVLLSQGALPPLARMLLLNKV